MDKKIYVILIFHLLLIPSLFSAGQSLQKMDPLTENNNYIIITSNYLQNSVEELKEWRESQGFNVEIITTLKDAEEIRNFLKTKYNESNIEYLLIVGSINTISMKYCYPVKDEHGQGYALPTDYYYAELTHDWDLDGDGYAGEYEDDIKNNTDLLPELIVGRIPFDSPFRVKSFCKKIINYEKDNNNWKEKALFLASIQFYKPQFMDNAELAETLKEEIFKPNNYSCTSLYETDGEKPSDYTYDYPLNHFNTIKTWNEGHGFVSIIGRGTSNTARRRMWVRDNGNEVPEDNEVKTSLRYVFLCSFDKYFLKNEKPSVVYSFTCYTAQPKLNNLCSSLLQRGAIAFIGPATGNMGGAQLKYNFSRYFASTNMRLGDAFTKAKEEYININGGIDQTYFYYENFSVIWTLFNTGFYGDPATIKFLPPCT